jgi:hypothetical protein
MQEEYFPFPFPLASTAVTMVPSAHFTAIDTRSILTASVYPSPRLLHLGTVEPLQPSLLYPHFTIANSSTLWHPPSAIAISISGIASRLHHFHVPHQLWVGQSLSFPSGCDDRQSSSSCPHTVMAIADVLFLPWSNWARLSFVRDIPSFQVKVNGSLMSYSRAGTRRSTRARRYLRRCVEDYELEKNAEARASCDCRASRTRRDGSDHPCKLRHPFRRQGSRRGISYRRCLERPYCYTTQRTKLEE